MIDLHTHTNASDGSSTPAELLRAARQVGLKALAITDHDTLKGFDAALPLAADYGVELVCGIELTTVFDGGGAQELPMHVLGYFLRDIPGDDFRKWLTSISSTRNHRNLQLMERLKASNIDISWDDFPGLGPDFAARPHFAKVLVAKGYVPNLQKAFDVYLNDSALSGLVRRLPSAQKAVRMIRQNGGIASLAHPGRVCCNSISDLKRCVAELIDNGLNAIEVYHSDHAPAETAGLLKIAAEFQLLGTGGTDYHGDNKPEIQ
ncbi:MAG: PHP domain-containing protein, partial [Candidatus Angelobacter sp.]